METTEKIICRELADLLAAYGVEDVILSPGSRNAPLIIAVARHATLNYRVVVDERSAAFIGLGMAAQTRKPVALVCTSGTAMLNYAPAIAEAFYREVPLIVITADRPQEWIDQDDSQTINQFGAITNIVKHSVNIPVETGNSTQLWMVNRLLNDALAIAVAEHKGPVHINVQLDLPLTKTTVVDIDSMPRKVEVTTPSMSLPVSQVRAYAAALQAPKKVMVICGFMPPSQRINRAIARLAALPNVVVLTEAQANIHAAGCIPNIDRVLASMSATDKEALAPDIVITIGGSLVSRYIKGWLRRLPNLQHWQVGIRGLSVDAFMHLSRRFEVTAEAFLPQLAAAMQPYAKASSDYNTLWHATEMHAGSRHETFVSETAWCDLTAVSKLLEYIPDACNIQVSNGTSVRYLQLFDYMRFHRIDCNRGVSGIDGSTSTAIGACMAYKAAPTVLLTGDMSMQYDLGALATNDIPDNFRIAVLNNGGGGIFRFLKSIAGLPEIDECFAAHLNLPLKQLAEAFGFRYLEASSFDQMDAVAPAFMASKKCILNIRTDGRFSADVLNNYFKFLSE